MNSNIGVSQVVIVYLPTDLIYWKIFWLPWLIVDCIPSEESAVGWRYGGFRRIRMALRTRK